MLFSPAVQKQGWLQLTGRWKHVFEFFSILFVTTNGPLASSPLAGGHHRSVGWHAVVLKSRDRGSVPSVATGRTPAATKAKASGNASIVIWELNSGKTQNEFRETS